MAAVRWCSASLRCLHAPYALGDLHAMLQGNLPALEHLQLLVCGELEPLFQLQPLPDVPQLGPQMLSALQPESLDSHAQSFPLGVVGSWEVVLAVGKRGEQGDRRAFPLFGGLAGLHQQWAAVTGSTDSQAVLLRATRASGPT